MEQQLVSRLKVRVEDLLNKVNQLLSESKLSETLSEKWKENFWEQIYEKFVSIVTLEHLLRKDLETFFASSSDWVLRPKLSSEQVLQTLPDLLRTKPDQEYTNYLNESYLLYLQNASVDEKNVGALNQLQLSMQRTCNTLLERVEEFLEQDNNNDNKPISSTDKSLEKTVEKSLSWLAYEKGSGLT